ncbi:hypothetical protein Val02_45200 [Virgisporangium aliadipatigenens]|uniref:Uncharacterized protein n=1 Tax=Virgisporangium aliadipatigenens TaxID=741659 RepID=A0A8J4DRG4_9ACTN|nr:hypothetical protein [Virgisporangium aliadipatigenens]GIJ47634.1 hypothetical protein Val02_45200 [Virgisporangium aliadipatigenens]
MAEDPGYNPDPNINNNDYLPDDDEETETPPPPEEHKDIPDAYMPELTQQWTDAPHLPDKKIDKDAKGQEAKEPPVHAAWTVRPGQLRDMENGLLGELKTQISDYMALRSYVQARKGTAGNDGLVHDSIFQPRIPPGWVEIATEGLNVQVQHMNTDNLLGAKPEQAVEYGDMMENALAAAANAIFIVGEFVQCLNEAAQAYVAADITATMPPPPKIGNG